MLENIFLISLVREPLYAPPPCFYLICTFKIADAQIKNGTQQPNYLLFVCCSISKKVVLKGRL